MSAQLRKHRVHKLLLVEPTGQLQHWPRLTRQKIHILPMAFVRVQPLPPDGWTCLWCRNISMCVITLVCQVAVLQAAERLTDA
jgi:hypothetical protein